MPAAKILFLEHANWTVILQSIRGISSVNGTNVSKFFVQPFSVLSIICCLSLNELLLLSSAEKSIILSLSSIVGSFL